MEQPPSAAYWCYSCESTFSSPTHPHSCPLCLSEAIEITDSPHPNAPPAGFQVYQIPSAPPQPAPSPPPNPLTVTSHRVFQFGPTLISMSTTNSQSQISINLPQIPANPFGLTQMFGGMVESLIGPNGIVSLLNSLSGERNLTPASPADISKLAVVPRVQECSICQEVEEGEEGEGGEGGRGEGEREGFRLQCGHSFHKTCLGPWLEKTNTCPSCRCRL